MPQLSVVTPCTRRDLEMLAMAQQSLEQLSLPAGWELEWLVQQDGPATEVSEVLPRWARYQANGYHEGVSVTRNLALGRAQGALVVPLDDDDMVDPDGMSTLVAALLGAPWAGWAAGRADDLVEDERVSYPLFLPEGRVRAGHVFDAWGERFPLMASGSMLMRTDVLRAVGGWPALPVSEDLAMACLVTESCDGLVIDEVVNLYRRHAGSNNETPRGDSYRPHAHRFIRDMVMARRKSAMSHEES